MPRSHLHVEARPIFRTIWEGDNVEWDVVIPRQLWGLDVFYRVYVPLLFAQIALRGSYGTALREGVTMA